jgi:hypothetical protein
MRYGRYYPRFCWLELEGSFEGISEDIGPMGVLGVLAVSVRH